MTMFCVLVVVSLIIDGTRLLGWGWSGLVCSASKCEVEQSVLVVARFTNNTQIKTQSKEKESKVVW